VEGVPDIARIGAECRDGVHRGGPLLLGKERRAHERHGAAGECAGSLQREDRGVAETEEVSRPSYGLLLSQDGGAPLLHSRTRTGWVIPVETVASNIRAASASGWR